MNRSDCDLRADFHHASGRNMEEIRGVARRFGQRDEHLVLPAWHARAGSRLERAAWLELATLLEPYLLSAQGDRVAMAHGVEGRFPFLDHRVFAYSARLPAEKKLQGMREKVALREVAAKVLYGNAARVYGL